MECSRQGSKCKESELEDWKREENRGVDHNITFFFSSNPGKYLNKLDKVKEKFNDGAAFSEPRFRLYYFTHRRIYSLLLCEISKVIYILPGFFRIWFIFRDGIPALSTLLRELFTRLGKGYVIVDWPLCYLKWSVFTSGTSLQEANMSSRFPDREIIHHCIVSDMSIPPFSSLPLSSIMYFMCISIPNYASFSFHCTY